MARIGNQRHDTARAPQRQKNGHLSPPPGFTLYEDEDKFALPESAMQYQVDHGLVYQWKRLTNVGKVDYQHQAALAANRWVPVPLDRHPEMGTDGSPDDKQQIGRFGHKGDQKTAFADCIIRFGEILMERSAEIEEYVRGIEKERADSQVKNQMQRVRMAPEGTLAGVNRQRVGSVTRSRDLSIPEDAE